MIVQALFLVDVVFLLSVLVVISSYPVGGAQVQLEKSEICITPQFSVFRNLIETAIPQRQRAHHLRAVSECPDCPFGSGLNMNDVRFSDYIQVM